jgi:predicted glutamine amidotransferase
VTPAKTGGISIENTHPFYQGEWIFADDGTIPEFDLVRPLIPAHTDPLHRVEIAGTTDSKDVFRYLMSLFLNHPEQRLKELVHAKLEQVIAWFAQVAQDRPVELNIVLPDGSHVIGLRYNRSLHYLGREHMYDCLICGKRHVLHKHDTAYRSVEIASEPVTPNEIWYEVPNKTIYSIAEDYRLDMEPLGR